MFTYAKPEEAGISSENIRQYIDILETSGLSTHNVIIAKGDKIVYESYWAPFHKDFLHRMYSVTKSFVAIAIGFLIQDGKLSLDDRIVDKFPADITEGANENMKKQTIRNMLMMSTGFPAGNGNWFARKPDDRVKDYFSHGEGYSKIPGSFFEYDSHGSFVLGAMVERISGMEFIDYLRLKLFDKIGVSKEAFCLKCPGGYAWGDSALLCTATDLLKVAKFTMNLGSWEGEQILDADYLREATSNLIPTHWDNNRPSNFGYGYLIWRQQQNSFFFNGMGCQFAVCVPDKDMILIYNGDNQGMPSAKTIIIDNFYNVIVNNTSDAALPSNDSALKKLTDMSKNLKLMHCKDDTNSPFEKKINGKKFVLDKNQMGIKDVTFTFNGDEGVMAYTNAQGYKELPFGLGKNIFCKFPQSGYSDMCGSKNTENLYYDCASSAEWLADTALYLNVQIIDKYFGRLHMYFSFTDENTVSVRMTKVAEDFLEEYQGMAIGLTE